VTHRRPPHAVLSLARPAGRGPVARPPRAALAAAATLLAAGALAACGPASRPAAPAPMAGKRVEGRGGMVSASHPDAAAAGAQLLAAGGNAVDAFVATAFALSVTDISQTGLGGGGAMTYYQAATRRAEHLSFYPRAGEDAAWARADTGRPRGPGRAAATPGMVAGLLAAHAKWGVRPLAEVMAPAIRLAREGFVVSPLLARTIVSSRAKLQAEPEAAALLMPGGEALRPGERLVQATLAATLETIRDRGAAGFYTGGIAERLSADVRQQGGLITVGDMAGYPVTWMRPLCTPWRGYTVLGAPPPMGGSVVLEMLQLAEQSGVTRAGGLTDRAGAATSLADAMRVANADARWRGDPAVMAVPARGVSHPGFAAQRLAALQGAPGDTVRAGDPWALDSAAVPAGCAPQDPYPRASAPVTGAAGAAARESAPDSAEGTSYTSHLSVVDAAGNAVAATTTVGVLFGSGVYTDGFFLNSAGSNFDARTRGVNRYANSTMSPTVILEGGQVRLVIGAAGSQYIQPAITQVTVRMLAFGEDPYAAIAAPRLHASAGTREVEVEPGFAPGVYAGLVARGYRPASRVADITFGGVHAVYVRRDGTRIGVADPRRDGVAAGQ
jgi:gamma-glutamyltranspeptidase/glutathione hydrolase